MRGVEAKGSGCESEVDATQQVGRHLPGVQVTPGERILESEVVEVFFDTRTSQTVFPRLAYEGIQSYLAVREVLVVRPDIRAVH